MAAGNSTTDDTTLVALGYVFAPLGSAFVYFTADEGDRFSRFHGMQGILWGIVGVVISWTLIGGLVWLLVNLFIAYKVYSGEDYRLPYIADFAEDQI